MASYDEYIETVQKEIPSFAIVRKQDSYLMRVIDVLLKIISFGQITNFMDAYTTTIGSKIYVSGTWDAKSDNSRIIVIRHEVIHIRQFKKYTYPLYIFLYLFIFFPIGLAYFRMKFERAGYTETLKAVAEIGGIESLKRMNREFIIRQFTGPGYLWAWPFRKSVEKWYDSTVEQILKLNS
jgi:hypothetical protein